MRIALCISGTIQDFEKCLVSLNSKVMQSHKCDLFIVLDKDVSKEDFNKIKSIYRPKSIIINEYIPYPEHLKSDFKLAFKYFYDKYQCTLLKKQFESKFNFKYDLVIQTNFNILFHNNLNNQEMSNMDSLYVPIYNNDNGINPYIAFGNSDIMELYSNIYNFVYNYSLTNTSISLEKILLWGLNRSQLRVRLSDINLSVFTDGIEKNISDVYHNRRKKVAICMSGLMRMAIENFVNFRKTFLLTHYDCDVFIDTWNSVQLSNMSQRSTLQEFLNNLNKLYKPVKFNVENSFNFNYSPLVHIRNCQCRNIQDLLSMCYKIQSCNKLKINYEMDNNFIYDSVVRIRSDMECTSKIDVLQDIHMLNIPDHADYSGINDQFAYSNSKNMDIYSTWFNKIDEFLMMSDKLAFNMECFTKLNIIKNRLPLKRFNCEYNILRLNGIRQNNRHHAKMFGNSDMQPDYAWTEATGLPIKM